MTTVGCNEELKPEGGSNETYKDGNLMKLDEEEAQAPVEQAFPLLEESRDACRLSKSSRTGIQSVMSAAMNFKKCGSVLITGASRGLGLQLVDSLASGQFSPGKIIATCRNPGNAQVNTSTKLAVCFDG